MSVENIVNINESNLQQVLEQSMTTPVLFYFWSERSQHCLQLTPILESLAAQYNGQFILAKLDCDAEQMIAAQLEKESRTVAAITTAGVVLPIINVTHADPALMVLATGAGSVIASHVNDPGFWLFKGYFNLTVGETLRTWTVMETLISIMGLLGVLAINAVLH